MTKATPQATQANPAKAAPAAPEGYHPQPGGSYLLQPDGTPAATEPAKPATPPESE